MILCPDRIRSTNCGTVMRCRSTCNAACACHNVKGEAKCHTLVPHLFHTWPGPGQQKCGNVPQHPSVEWQTLGLHGGRSGCGGWFWVGAMANAADFEGHPALGPSGSLPKHASWPKLAKIHQNARGGWKRLSPRPKCKRFVGTSKQLQKPHKLAPGHALARFWPPGPMQQARGLA